MHLESFPILLLLLISSIPHLIKPAAAGCEPRSCGNVTNIRYPFWFLDQGQPPCGPPDFGLSCEAGLPILVNSFARSYYVHHISYGRKSFWVRNNYFTQKDCAIAYFNISLGLAGPFIVSAANRELFFFHNCSAPPYNRSTRIPCAPNATFAYLGGSYDGSFDPPASSSQCNVSVAPVLLQYQEEESRKDPVALLKNGFLVEWMEWGDDETCGECIASNGMCRPDGDAKIAFVCICPDGRRDPRNCKSSSRKWIIIGLVAGVVGFLLAFAVLFLLVQKRNKSKDTQNFHKKRKDIQNLETFLKDHGSLVPKRYKYSDLKKITKSFHEKLGQGGYGNVFKGKLQDGRLVAVKMLSKSKENGAEFINEVASIGRTSHVNIVTLLGFCSDGRKRALVYEFMSNGSLEKYIYSDKPKTSLPWEKLYQVAIGIARGLEYLHRGCNTRIVHFDIKPHNILLDEDFCPKISDFGLAKLCPQKESIVSMADARGTVGYIAPEVFSRSFGVVSTKSDVYSYGMMVLEMVGGRRNVKACADRTSEIYFPHWVYEHLDRGGDLRAYDVMAETEEMARKMILVGLWCIQTMPANRPSMSRVAEMLEGRVSDLEMPPKPCLSSPVRSVVNSPQPSVANSSS